MTVQQSFQLSNGLWKLAPFKSSLVKLCIDGLIVKYCKSLANYLYAKENLLKIRKLNFWLCFGVKRVFKWASLMSVCFFAPWIVSDYRNGRFCQILVSYFRLLHCFHFLYNQFNRYFISPSFICDLSSLFPGNERDKFSFGPFLICVCEHVQLC